MARTLAIVAAILLTSVELRAQARNDDYRVPRTTVPPAIDGVLDDEVWQQQAPLPSGEWVSYNPLRGESEQQRTRVWMAYDDQALYFAFRCYDAEPERITLRCHPTRPVDLNRKLARRHEDQAAVTR